MGMCATVAQGANLDPADTTSLRCHLGKRHSLPFNRTVSGS